MPLHITTSARLGPLEGGVAEVANECRDRGEPLRLNFLARLYRGQRRYIVWPHLGWQLEADTIAEVETLHEALREFFACAAVGKVEDLTQQLIELKALRAAEAKIPA